MQEEIQKYADLLRSEQTALMTVRLQLLELLNRQQLALVPGTPSAKASPVKNYSLFGPGEVPPFLSFSMCFCLCLCVRPCMYHVRVFVSVSVLFL